MTTSSVCPKHHRWRTFPTPSSASRPAVFGCLTHISPLNANESSSVVCYSSSVGIPKVLFWFVTVYRVFELRQRLGSDLSSLWHGPSCTPISIKSLPFCLTARPHRSPWWMNPGHAVSVLRCDAAQTVSPVCDTNLIGWFALKCLCKRHCRILRKNILLVRLFKDTNKTTLTETATTEPYIHNLISYYIVPLHTGYIHLPQILK